MTTLHLERYFQGPTGTGQGGWIASKLVDIIGQPATIAIKSFVPIETDLDVVQHDDGWSVIDNSTLNTTGEPTTILEAQRWDPDFCDTEPVTIAAASAARARFPWTGEDHPVPVCFSCGIQPDSMNVHAGPLPDGRWATDWTVPDWTVAPDGTVDDGALWAAIDCTAAIYVHNANSYRTCFTAQFAAEVVKPLTPGATYALVGFDGDWEGGWVGRKRGASSAAFDDEGTCVARSRSFWVAVE